MVASIQCKYVMLEYLQGLSKCTCLLICNKWKTCWLVENYLYCEFSQWWILNCMGCVALNGMLNWEGPENNWSVPILRVFQHLPGGIEKVKLCLCLCILPWRCVVEFLTMAPDGGSFCSGCCAHRVRVPWTQWIGRQVRKTTWNLNHNTVVGLCI